MIIHCVFCDLREDVSRVDLQAVLEDLAEFSTKIPDVIDFAHGPNRDFENKSKNYDAGFVIRFKTQDALTHYANHPTHQELGARLCAFCNGGADGIVVFDIEA